jgi:hypothetical protein
VSKYERGDIHFGARLVDAPPDCLKIDLRPSPRKFLYVELLEGDSGFFQEEKRAALIGIVRFGHPKNSNGEEEFPLPLRFVLLP